MSAGIPRLPVVESENSLPAPGSDESCWSTLAADSLSDYYSSSITDIRCNFNQESGVLDRSLLRNLAAAQFSGVAADRIGTGLAPLQCDSLTATTSLNQSASSSSSEDAQEKSNDSSGGGLKAATATSSKVKKKTQKKMRQARFAFMTKSEVDHLEDGYRWRKYGQKAVKNSPFPRSYYRCTNSKCTVKKRVERSWEDPTIVITTYEGQHCHHTNGFPRCGFILYEDVFSNQFALPPPRFYYPSQQIHSTTPSSNRLQIPGETTREDLSVLQVCDQSSVHTNMYQGLLEDIVSPRTRT